MDLRVDFSAQVKKRFCDDIIHRRFFRLGCLASFLLLFLRTGVTFLRSPAKKTHPLPPMVEVAIKIARIGLRKSREFIRRGGFCVWRTLVWFFFGQKRRLWKLVCIDGGINLTARKLGDRGLPPGWVAFFGGF